MIGRKAKFYENLSGGRGFSIPDVSEDLIGIQVHCGSGAERDHYFGFDKAVIAKFAIEILKLCAGKEVEASPPIGADW